MKRYLSLLIIFCSFVAGVCAQTVTTDSIARRVNTFGKQLPQEKVFVHMDNTSYFLGDTIFYKAYVTRSDSRRLSTLSGVLYVELLNSDGYMIERQIVRLKSGMGQGSIVLRRGKAHYAGYYELRAYTRWMLNFGRTRLPHKKSSEEWFVRKHMANEFYVDYDKLYSRTFPVYDAPAEPGEYFRDMTERPMQRLLGNTKDKEKTVINAYPEGGYLVAGVQNHLYFEAMREGGMHESGRVTITDSNGNEVAVGEVRHRGKGCIVFTPQPDTKYTLSIATPEERRARINLSKALTDGIAMHVEITSDSMLVTTAGSDDAFAGDLMITVMNQGVVCRTIPVASNARSFALPLDSLPMGVLNLTLYNADERILADRLAFNNHGLRQSCLKVEGIAQEYTPYAPIDLVIRRPEGSNAKAVMSVSIVDGNTSDQSADNSNLLTEMLLSSEIKGFVEAPTYYFERNDEEHRACLDLLMATQGWRRFSWRQQAHPELFTLTNLNEAQTPILNGAVYVYEGIRKTDPLQDEIEAELQAEIDEGMKFSLSQAPGMSEADQDYHNLLARRGVSNEANAHGRYQRNPGNLKREVNVHAEFVSLDDQPLVGDAVTENSMFNIPQPDLDGQFYMHLASADLGGKDADAEKLEKYHWVCADESKYADYYVRIADPFPRHAHPYNYYQRNMLEAAEEVADTAISGSFYERMMSEVRITSGHNIKRRFDAAHPALTLYGYTAFNMLCDAGLCPGQFVGAERFANDLARLLVGDMGVGRQYNLIVRRDGLPASHNMSTTDKACYDILENIDSVFIYTDYAPRNYGNPLWETNEQPEVIVDIHRFPSGGRQFTYRDRFYVRQGFNLCDEFYSPDYSRMPASSTPKADTRRTLLWMPYVMFDENGEARIKAFNNGTTSHIRVSVNGIDAQGTPLIY